MLLFLSKRDHTERDQKKPNNDQVCVAVQEAWRLSYKIGELGAEQTSAGWGISEHACHITDEGFSDEIDQIGADQTVVGMSFSEYSCNLDEQLEIIAKSNGCKLTPRPYG